MLTSHAAANPHRLSMIQYPQCQQEAVDVASSARPDWAGSSSTGAA